MCIEMLRKLSTDKQKAIHQGFWAMGNFESRMHTFVGVSELNQCSVTTPHLAALQDVVTLSSITSEMDNTQFVYVRVHSCSNMALVMVMCPVHFKGLH